MLKAAAFMTAFAVATIGARPGLARPSLTMHVTNS
jgi:hypothetical protein